MEEANHEVLGNIQNKGPHNILHQRMGHLHYKLLKFLYLIGLINVSD